MYSINHYTIFFTEKSAVVQEQKWGPEKVWEYKVLRLIESMAVLKEIKLGCHDGNLGELFLFA